MGCSLQTADAVASEGAQATDAPNLDPALLHEPNAASTPSRMWNESGDTYIEVSRYCSPGKQYVISLNVSRANMYTNRSGSSPTL